MKSKRKIKKRKKSLILKAAIFAFAGYIVFNLYQTKAETDKKSQELEEARALLVEKQQENEELEQLLENSSEEEIMESIARNKLGYVLPDEKVYYDISSSK